MLTHEATGARITESLVRTYDALVSATAWLDALEVALIANVAPRTVRSHVKLFADKGVVQVQRVAPGYKYRWIEQPVEQKSIDFANSLKLAKEALQ